MLTFATDDKSLDLQALKISTEMNKAGNSDKYVANEEIDDFFVGNPDDFQEDVEKNQGKSRENPFSRLTSCLGYRMIQKNP